MLKVSDRLGSIGGLKGKVSAELFNAQSKEREFVVEKDNAVFAPPLNQAYLHLFLWQALLVFPYLATQRTVSDYLESWFRHMYLSSDNTDVVEGESTDVKYLVGYADRSATYSGTATDRGTLNLNESYVDGANNKVRFVFDFATDRANGTFQSVGFFNSHAGNVPSKPSTLFADKHMDKKFKCSIGTQLGKAVQTGVDEVTFVEFMVTAATTCRRVDIRSGDLLGSFTLKNHLGANLLRVQDVKKRGAFYYVLSMSTGNTTATMRLYKYSDLSQNALSEVVISLGIGTQNLNGMYTVSFDFISDTEIALVHGSYGTSDTVLNVPSYRIMYIIDITTGLATGRADIKPQYDFSDGSFRIQPQNAASQLDPWAVSFSYTVAVNVKDGLVHVTYFSEGGGYMLDLIYNISEDYLLESFRRVYVPNTATGIAYYQGLAVIDGDLCAFNTANNTNTTVSLFRDYYASGDARNTYGFYDIKWQGAKVSRVLLPAPVTKLNTQTMKVTYDIVFPEGMLS